MKSNKARIMTKIEKVMDDRCHRAAEALRTELRAVLNVVGARLISERSSFPSAPGMPPHKVTGFLRNSVTNRRVKSGAWRVAVGAFYGMFLEYGTARMLPRPFWTGTVWRMRDRMQRIMRGHGNIPPLGAVSAAAAVPPVSVPAAARAAMGAR